MPVVLLIIKDFCAMEFRLRVKVFQPKTEISHSAGIYVQEQIRLRLLILSRSVLYMFTNKKEEFVTIGITDLFPRKEIASFVTC